MIDRTEIDQKKDAMEILATVVQEESEGRGAHSREGFECPLVTVVTEQRPRNSGIAKADWKSSGVANPCARRDCKTNVSVNA